MTSGRFPLNGDADSERNAHNNNTANPTSASLSSSTSAALNTPTTNSNNSAADFDASGDGVTTEHIRKFVFTSASGGSFLRRQIVGLNNSTATPANAIEKLEIQIPELLQGGYSFYTWPSAPILAWFLWDLRHALVGKRILELGAGTALPGILAAKCGARVVLSDNCILPKSLAHIRKSCLANNLIPGQDIEVIGLSWGLLLHSLFSLGSLDLIIAADCFYDPTVFEDIIVSVSFLLERNPLAKFIFTYQERSADWSIEALLKKWKLCARQVNIDDIGKSSGVDLLELMGGHTIHLLEVTRDN